MQSVFVAPFAVLHHFDTFGRILLVLVCTIIAALAFCACKSNSFTHSLHLTQSFSARGQLTCLISISQAQCTSQQIFANFAFKKAGPSQRNYCSTMYRALQMVFYEGRSKRFSSLMRLSAVGFLGLTAPLALRVVMAAGAALKKGAAGAAGCVEGLCFKGQRKGSFPHFIVPPLAGGRWWHQPPKRAGPSGDEFYMPALQLI